AGARRGPRVLEAFDPEKLDVELETRLGRDRGRLSLFAVGEVVRDHELAFAAHLHSHDALVPALDDVAAPDGELERLALVPRAVELLPPHERAGVVHLHLLADFRLRPRTYLFVGGDELLRPRRFGRRFGRLERARARLVDLLRAGRGKGE